MVSLSHQCQVLRAPHSSGAQLHPPGCVAQSNERVDGMGPSTGGTEVAWPCCPQTTWVASIGNPMGVCEQLARGCGVICCPCHTVAPPVCPWVPQSSTGCSSVVVAWLCLCAHSQVLRLCSGWGDRGCPRGLLEGSRMQRLDLAVAQIQAGTGDVTWVVWHRTCLAGFPSSFSVPAPCRLCIRQFTLAVEAGRRRAEAGGSGAEAVWAVGGPSARASSVCDTRLVSPEWESCERGEI